MLKAGRMAADGRPLASCDPMARRPVSTTALKMFLKSVGARAGLRDRAVSRRWVGSSVLEWVVVGMPVGWIAAVFIRSVTTFPNQDWWMHSLNVSIIPNISFSGVSVSFPSFCSVPSLRNW